MICDPQLYDDSFKDFYFTQDGTLVTQM